MQLFGFGVVVVVAPFSSFAPHCNAVLHLGGTRPMEAVMKDCVNCSRVDFHHFDSVGIPKDASPETLSGKVVQIQEKLALFLALGSAFDVGVTMHPRWRMHDIRDAWDQTTEERYTQSQEVDPTRSHFPAHWRSMSVLCDGACKSMLGLEKALVGACRFFWIN